MQRLSLVIAALLCLGSFSFIFEDVILPDVDVPVVESQNVDTKIVNKMLHENYAALVDEVDFEVSSYLYMRDGALPEE